MRTGNNLEYLLSDKESLEDLLWDHKLDISGSVHSRMQELGITQAELASKMGMDRAQLCRILSDEGNITLKTIARFELALDFRLDSGFRYNLDPISITAAHDEEMLPQRNLDNWDVSQSCSAAGHTLSQSLK